MKGTGTGATYDRNRDVIWILADAHLIVAPDAAGAGAVDATALKAGLARADNFAKLEGNAHLLAENRNAQADVITAYLDEAGEKIQRLELREHSRIVGTGANAQTMVARNIDLTYAPDGRTLQSSKMMESAVIQLPGAAGGAVRRIAGNTIDTTMAPDGNAVTNLIAQDNVQVDLPAEGDAPARRIKSATLKAAGANEGCRTSSSRAESTSPKARRPPARTPRWIGMHGRCDSSSIPSRAWRGAEGGLPKQRPLRRR